MRNRGGVRAINVVSFEHDGQQKETFYGPIEEVECPAKCRDAKFHM